MENLDFCFQLLQTARSKKSIEHFEIYWENSSSLGIDIHEGKLDHLSRATDQGLAIRTLHDGRMGFAYTFDLSQQAIERAVRTASDIAELMPQDPLNALGFNGDRYAVVENFDQKGLDVSLDEKIQIAFRLEQAARAADNRIKRVRKASFHQSSGEVILVNSDGKKIRHEQSVFGTSIMCVAEQGESAETGYDSQYGCFLQELDPASVARTAVADAVELLGATKAPTMLCPAVFKNSVVAQLLGFLSGSFSAENVDKNFSLLVGKMGQKVFSEKLNLIDDGLLSKGLSSSPFDGEGAPCQRTPLIERGQLVNFLYDNYYARKLGAKTTGNSQRGGIKGPPGIGTSNYYLEKGNKSFQSLVGSISKGIYITDVMGLHTANPITGDFSVGASGLLIEGGAITSAVKGFAIAGNLLTLLKNVTEVGSDLKFWGSSGAPSFLVSEISVGGV